jgi:hypothetical protein
MVTLSALMPKSNYPLHRNRACQRGRTREGEREQRDDGFGTMARQTGSERKSRMQPLTVRGVISLLDGRAISCR